MLEAQRGQGNCPLERLGLKCGAPGPVVQVLGRAPVGLAGCNPAMTLIRASWCTGQVRQEKRYISPTVPRRGKGYGASFLALAYEFSLNSP